MKHPELIKALEPITSRVRRDICWKKTEDGPRRIKEALTDRHLDHHVNGGPAYGAAPIHPGQDVTLVAVLDLDSHKGETPWGELCDVAARVVEAGAAAGFEMTPFRSSGGRGLHLYMLWDQPQDAYSVRHGLAAVLAACGFRNGTKGVAKGEIEIFPKQNNVPADGFGNMFILPLAGKSVPLCPFTLSDMPKEYAIGMDWPVSAPVARVERPVVERQAVVPSADLDRVREALAAIPNSGGEELSYDDWRNVVFAIHHASDGGDEGRELAHEFSKRSSKYDADFLDNRVWPYVKTDNQGERGPVTAGTIFRMAREHGWVEPIVDDFETLPALIDGSGQPVRDLPRLKRDKHGQIEAVIENVVAVVRRSDVFGVRVAYDAFRDDIVVAPHGTDDWLPLRDADYTRYRCALADELGFKPVGSEMMRDAVVLAAEDCRIDSAQWWLGRQTWDGTPRVERFLIDYFGTEDTPYTRAVSRYLWSALAGRILSPGCQVDMVPILEGEQGLRKTSAVAAMAPGYSHFIEIGFDEKETDLARKMRGAMIAELGELHGLHAKAIEGVKKFITRRYENWTPKFKEFNTTFPRRLVFIGTTNQRELLADETGNRRWLPVHVERADVEGIARDRGQLWAEGAAIFNARGVEYQEAELLAAPEHEKYLAPDAWEEAVREWLETESDFGIDGSSGPKWGDVPFTTLQGALGAVGLQAAHVNGGVTRRLGAIFRKLGYKQKTTRIKGEKNPSKRWCADFC